MFLTESPTIDNPLITFYPPLECTLIDKLKRLLAHSIIRLFLFIKV